MMKDHRSKLINWFLTFLVVTLIANIFRSSSYLKQRGGIIDGYESELEAGYKQQEGLKRKLAQVQSTNYIEKEARNKLNLGKEGEIVLFLPSISPDETPTPTPVDTSANWQKWVKLFF